MWCNGSRQAQSALHGTSCANDNVPDTDGLSDLVIPLRVLMFVGSETLALTNSDRVGR